MEKITKLSMVVEMNGNGSVRRALASYVLAFEQLSQKAAQYGVYPIGLESGGFCDEHDVVFYGNSCPLCTSSG